MAMFKAINRMNDETYYTESSEEAHNYWCNIDMQVYKMVVIDSNTMEYHWVKVNPEIIWVVEE